MTPSEIEHLASELVADAARNGLWNRLSPATLQTIVRAVALDMQRDPEFLANIERIQEGPAD